MNLVDSRVELLKWFKTNVSKTRPRVVLPYAVTCFFEGIFVDALNNEENPQRLESSPAEELLDLVFNAMVASGTHNVKAGYGVLTFMASVIGHIVDHGQVEDITFEVVRKSGLRALGLKSKDLSFEGEQDRRWIVSSPKFEQRFGIKVRVPGSPTPIG
jgi:hypothetical protein